MADAVTIGNYQDWLSNGVSRTRWNSLTLNTTGDVGQRADSYSVNGSVQVLITSTGSLTSVGVVVFEESGDGTTWSTGRTVCGSELIFDSATGVYLSTGVMYKVRSGALFYRPRFQAGASGSDIVNVTLIQRA